MHAIVLANKIVLTHSFAYYKLILATGFDTHWVAEQSLDCKKLAIQPHLGYCLWHALGNWKVTRSYWIYDTNSSWPLALTRTGSWTVAWVYEIYDKSSSWPLALTRSGELRSRSIVWRLQYKLILATGFDTHWGAEKLIDCMRFTIQPHLGNWLWRTLGSWKVAWLYGIYNTNSSWPLALIRTAELNSRLIVWHLQYTFMHWGAENSLHHMKSTIQIHLGHRLWHAAGNWKVARPHEIYNTK